MGRTSSIDVMFLLGLLAVPAGGSAPVEFVISANFGKCISPAGEHATCKHLGGGYTHFTLASCKALMLRLGGDSINFRSTGTCWVKKCGSKDMHYSDEFGEYQVYSKYCVPCPFPSAWCSAPGDVLTSEKDCDGDGVADPYCTDTAQRHGYLASDSSCRGIPKPCGEAANEGLFGRLKDEMEHHASGFSKLVKEAEDEEHKIEAKLQPAEKAMAEVYKGMNQEDYNAPSKLGGNDESVVNHMVYSIVGFICVATIGAGLVDYFLSPRCMEGRPKFWAISMLGSSYCLLIPGLCNVLLSFSIVVNVVGHRIRVHPNASEPACTESTPGLVHLLWDTNGKTGAVLLVLFAMVVPALELIFLILGEIFRFRGSSASSRVFGAVIIWVQHRSKWAAPDMFAYTLLVYLIRTLDHDPLILTKAQLDIGFACFCAFCVCATVSALGFPLPVAESPQQQRLQEEQQLLKVTSPNGGSPILNSRPSNVKPPLLLRTIGKWGVALLATAMFVPFFHLLEKGAKTPVMAFRINEKPLYKPVGPLPESAKAAVDMLDIPHMLASDVSLKLCVETMAGWAKGGEATSALATVMWAVFVLGLTALNGVLLLLSAWRLCLCSGGNCFGGSDNFDTWEPSARPEPCPFLRVSRLLKKLAMLDVAVVGIYLVTYCMAIYQNIGVIVSCKEGVAILFAAEVLHNLLYWMVSSVADYPSQAVPSVEEEIPEDQPELAKAPMECDLSLRCLGKSCMLMGTQ